MNSKHGFSVLATTTLNDVGFLRVEQRTLATPSGEHIERYVVVHPGAVAVVPRAGDDVILVAQYRAAVDAVVLEIPAGKLDQQGEEPRAAAERELLEETGYTAGNIAHLTDLWTAVGFSNERISIYVATQLEPGDPQPIGEEEHAAEIIRMSWDQALGSVLSGEITDAKTVAALLLVEHRGPS